MSLSIDIAQVAKFRTERAAISVRSPAPSRVRTRRDDRLLAIAAAGLAAIVLAATLVHGHRTLQPPPDATFAFRV